MTRHTSDDTLANDPTVAIFVAKPLPSGAMFEHTRLCTNKSSPSPASLTTVASNSLNWVTSRCVLLRTPRSCNQALTKRSHTRTSSTPLPSDILRQSLQPSAWAIGCPKKTRSSGSTLHLYTRTPTRASKVVARTGASQPCHRPPRLILHRTQPCQWPPCPEAMVDLSTTAANAAAEAPPCHLILSSEWTADMTSMSPCQQDTINLQPVDTTIWCSRSASYIKHFHDTVADFYYGLGVLGHGSGVMGHWRWFTVGIGGNG